MVKISYILEIGGNDKCLNEMGALELENFDDVENWIVESLDCDCEYNNIVFRYNKKRILENKDKRVIILIVEIVSEYNKNVECIIESNLDVVSDIIYKMII